MTNASSVTVPIVVAAGMNIVFDYRSKDGKNVPRILFGSVALFAGLTAVGEFVDWDIAFLLAVIYLLHTLLTDGQQAIEWFSDLSKGIGTL